MLSVNIIVDISLWRSGRNRPELILHWCFCWWFRLATKPRMIGLRISTGLPILPMLVTRRCRGWGSKLRGLAGRRRVTGTSIGASALSPQLLRTGQSGIDPTTPYPRMMPRPESGHLVTRFIPVSACETDHFEKGQSGTGFGRTNRLTMSRQPHRRGFLIHRSFAGTLSCAWLWDRAGPGSVRRSRGSSVRRPPIMSATPVSVAAAATALPHPTGSPSSQAESASAITGAA